MTERDLVGRLMDFEAGEMEPDEVLGFFQDLLDSGMCWQLQGSYGRACASLIEQGLIIQREQGEV